MPDHATRMMDEFDRWVIRICKVLVALFLISAYLLAVVWWLEPRPPRRPYREFTPAEKRWIAERYRYHGISGSVLENGQHYFYRDGKRCKL